MNPNKAHQQKGNGVPSHWQGWAGKLDRLGLRSLTSALLETGGGLNILLAQLVYIGSPLASTWIKDEELLEMASVLENPQQSRRFAALLREES